MADFAKYFKFVRVSEGGARARGVGGGYNFAVYACVLVCVYLRSRAYARMPEWIGGGSIEQKHDCAHTDLQLNKMTQDSRIAAYPILTVMYVHRPSLWRSLVRRQYETRRALDVLLLLVWMIHIAACYWNLLGSSNEKNGDRYVVVR